MISGFYAVLMVPEERESVCCWARLRNSSIALLLWINSFYVALFMELDHQNVLNTELRGGGRGGGCGIGILVHWEGG